jgi:predicted nucleotidyltransferase
MHIFDEIQSLKRQLIPDDRLILFGSQARGDAHENSDWDLLAILNSERRSWRKDFNQYVYPFSEIGDSGASVFALQITTCPANRLA